MATSQLLLSGTERESFFAAQARYRSSARRWSLLMALVVFAMTLVVSLLLAPAAVALAGLLVDVVNLAVPVPDVLGKVGHLLDAVIDSELPVPLTRLVALGVVAAPPGFMILVGVWTRLGRIAFERNPDALRDAIGLRDPHTGDLEEEQLANVVAEMAIATGGQPPRLALIDSAACNAGLRFRVSSPYPRIATRIARLDAMGATVSLVAKPPMPLGAWLVLAPLVVLAVSLLGAIIVLGTWLSLALNGFSLVIPTVLLHAALRALGHG